MYCPGGNTTDPIWRVLASSDGISSLTPLKPQHSNPNPNSLANQLKCIDFLTPPTPLIVPQRLPAFLESLMPLKNWCSIHAIWSKSSLKHSICFCGIFPSLKHNFIAYRSSKVSDCIFEIHQLWQSGFSRVYSNCCCNCSFKPEIIKIGQSSHNMYRNNLLNFQESIPILNACTKTVWKLIEGPTYIYIYIYIYIYGVIGKLLHAFCLSFMCSAAYKIEKVNGGKKNPPSSDRTQLYISWRNSAYRYLIAALLRLQNPLDWEEWGTVEQEINKMPCKSLDQLKERIAAAFNNLSLETVKSFVWDSEDVFEARSDFFE